MKMWLFSYAGADSVGPIAAGTSKRRVFAYATRYIHRMDDVNFKFKLITWRGCEDGEYAIEDPETGEIYGWLNEVNGVR